MSLRNRVAWWDARAFAPSVEVADGVATMRLHGAIDDWGADFGVSSAEFGASLDTIRAADEIRVHINSPGGMVYDGLAILNALRAHPARVVAIVDGIAASAASFIAAGADELVMAPNSELMIHDGWGAVMGPAQDMRAMADRLDAVSDNIASIYAAKAGGDVGSWRELMREETWFSAQEAVEAGLADRISAPNAAAASSPPGAAAAFDLTRFRYPGRAAAPGPHEVATEIPHASGDARAHVALIRAQSWRRSCP